MARITTKRNITPLALGIVALSTSVTLLAMFGPRLIRNWLKEDAEERKLPEGGINALPNSELLARGFCEAPSVH